MEGRFINVTLYVHLTFSIPRSRKKFEVIYRERVWHGSSNTQAVVKFHTKLFGKIQFIYPCDSFNFELVTHGCFAV